ncbi:MAG: glycogen-binding domain-containing protein [Candidatus Eisenbacteria bacterium]|uniref:Glycogen-binding domain-containing protein n=1 Tax=Eiseniibacteriota bacterium TaxID=2212470 RepID=A0A948W5L1_UNCEI|nr:glycogen-binding domain-containing protein [Candidatus Eisenbacteria bacterium]MBU1948020.1 glycogen-binding domain-containing protein [Candidatus Eisenbacteria bacterium]MBU2690115.1 glycogen-binding domain-containing protein [Candidatus Eisenbacteria bacterium]
MISFALSIAPGHAAVESTGDGIRFTHIAPAALSVALAGDFNNWSATANPMGKDGDLWSAVIELEPGQHEYKFVVDGQWMADPENPVTVGEYGNSGITVSSEGALIAMKATSNTPLSPKLWIEGRTIALYLSEKSKGPDARYELHRPKLDMDLGFRVRVNEDMEAYILTNINNESENVDFYQTRLNFDRGSLIVNNPSIYLKAWDGDEIGIWDDPLHLIGDIGIYHHAYGFNAVGVQAKKKIRKFDFELIYSDDSEPGGTDHPGIEINTLGSEEHRVFLDGGLLGFKTDKVFDYRMNDTDNGMDVAALRVKRRLDRMFDGRIRLGVSYRLNRGFNPGSLAFMEVDTSDASRTTGELYEYGATFERAQFMGGDIQFDAAENLIIDLEYLHGSAWIETFSGSKSKAVLQTVAEEDTLAGRISRFTETSAVGGRDFDLDSSNRMWLGLQWDKGFFGAKWRLSMEYQDHDLDALAMSAMETPPHHNIENSVTIWRGEFNSAGFHFPLLGLAADTKIAFEFHNFSYADDAPWESQFWFDTRNLWLENGEHQVSYHRMTLLGGRDAFVWHPDLTFHLEQDHKVDLIYEGTFSAEGFDGKPKYLETILQLRGFIYEDWRLSCETRIAKYDDPVLELKESYHCSYLELAYQPADGITLALSYGVDPYVVDGVTNRYDKIGRDQYLFNQNANGATAESNFLGLRRIIERAEQALEDERRIQLEGILNF